MSMHVKMLLFAKSTVNWKTSVSSLVTRVTAGYCLHLTVMPAFHPANFVALTIYYTHNGDWEEEGGLVYCTDFHHGHSSLVVLNTTHTSTNTTQIRQFTTANKQAVICWEAKGAELGYWLSKTVLFTLFRSIVSNASWRSLSRLSRFASDADATPPTPVLPPGRCWKSILQLYLTICHTNMFKIFKNGHLPSSIMM